MKEFNLEAALNGEPVMLRNGQKAIIYYCVHDNFKFDEKTPDTFPLKGMVFDEEGYLDDSSVTWRRSGRFRYSEDEWDIVGMWKEPKKQISIEDLPKPFKPEEKELYYYINNGCVCRNSFWSGSDENLAKNAQCFKTREDAKKWLDFMKGMLE